MPANCIVIPLLQLEMNKTNVQDRSSDIIFITTTDEVELLKKKINLN